MPTPSKYNNAPHTAEAAATASTPTAVGDPNKELNKVFVGGLPHEIDRDALKEIFSEFAPVTDTIVMV